MIRGFWLIIILIFVSSVVFKVLAQVDEEGRPAPAFPVPTASPTPCCGGCGNIGSICENGTLKNCSLSSGGQCIITKTTCTNGCRENAIPCAAYCAASSPKPSPSPCCKCGTTHAICNGNTFETCKTNTDGSCTITQISCTYGCVQLPNCTGAYCKPKV